MPLLHIIGWSVAVITLIYTALGLPMQIRKNFQQINQWL